MQAFVFSFTADSSGTADNITLPQDFPAGKKRILIRPPAGHAWTFYGLSSTGYPLDPDQEFQCLRSDGEAAFVAGETIGSAANDTGSGTFYAVAP